MATIQPFRALRPVPEQAEAVASVPYDVISTPEARAMAAGQPDSFLHIIRPEIDLPDGIDEHDDAVYEKGAENLRRYAQSAISLQEEAPALYVYRLVMDGQAQTGLFGCVAVAEYDDDTILKHEKTRPDKEDDRTRHILTQRAHAEPVMLTYRDVEAVDRLVLGVQAGAPLYDFTADDGVRHTIWRAADPHPFVEAFASVEKLYVADGHHRCKAASRAAEALRGAQMEEEPAFAFFPAVLFPLGQMRILPYNRIVYRLPASPEAFFEGLAGVGDLEVDITDPHPTRPGEVCLYFQGQWHRLTLPQTRRPTVADRLDVARLGEWILEPLLGITDPRTDPNIDFVGGIRGTGALERRVDTGTAALAIAMYPTRIEELVDVSDAGLLMPPKSTWFEPKLRSGLLVHLFESLSL
jgi:uncharacterized protein (DUF1015 family)